MLTALTCEREMLTFPLPARIKTPARDTEHDHTSSSADFILKSIFPSGLWTLDLRQVRKMTIQRKFPVTQKQMPGHQQCQREGPLF